MSNITSWNEIKRYISLIDAIIFQSSVDKVSSQDSANTEISQFLEKISKNIELFSLYFQH